MNDLVRNQSVEPCSVGSKRIQVAGQHRLLHRSDFVSGDSYELILHEFQIVHVKCLHKESDIRISKFRRIETEFNLRSQPRLSWVNGASNDISLD